MPTIDERPSHHNSVMLLATNRLPSDKGFRLRIQHVHFTAQS